MKKIWLWLGEIACKKSLPNSQKTNLNFFHIENIQSGKWKISYYFDNYNDETSKFSGYVLIFRSDGDFIAAKEDLTSNGKWLFNEVQKRLKISINSEDPLVDLDDEWTVTQQTENILILGDDKLQSNEQLHLMKINF